MSINSVKRALRTLPYTEMKALGQQINDRLEDSPVNVDELCDVLAKLPIVEDKMLETEDTFLSRAFTKKRGGRCTISLKKVAGGWEVSTGDFTHTGGTLRGAVSELLDQIAAYEALVPGEGRAI